MLFFYLDRLLLALFIWCFHEKLCEFVFIYFQLFFWFHWIVGFLGFSSLLFINRCFGCFFYWVFINFVHCFTIFLHLFFVIIDCFSISSLWSSDIFLLFGRYWSIRFFTVLIRSLAWSEVSFRFLKFYLIRICCCFWNFKELIEGTTFIFRLEIFGKHFIFEILKICDIFINLKLFAFLLFEFFFLNFESLFEDGGF